MKKTRIAFVARNMTRILVPLFALLVLVAGAARAADFPLPASDWYAVTWEDQDDTLHWINASGEQASIPRPALDGQISLAQTRLHISPDGRYLVVISPLLNGHEGIGFYNFETGQFAQIHETQDNEIFLPAGPAPFTESSTHFVIPLRNQSTGDWRMIVFEAATGNVTGVLNRTAPNMPVGFLTDLTWWPSVVQFNLDEALNTLEVRFQFVTQVNVQPTIFLSFAWRLPPNDNVGTVVADTIPFSQYAGLDIHPQTGEMLVASFENGLPPVYDAANTISIRPGADALPVPVASEPAGSARLPRWLNDGDWLAYYGTNGAFAPHWTVLTRDGQTQLPLSPAIISVYHTRDGFLSKSSLQWRLDHATSLELEAFAEPVGATIYEPGTSFAVVYTTPASTLFALTSVAEPVGEADPVVQGPDDLQAVPETDPDAEPQPVVCPAAPAPRLTVGGFARVTFTDGSPLNIRVEPAGALLTQAAEGTVMPVIGGPVCAGDYLYWRVRLTDQNNAEGWAAEGTPQLYFLEPYTPGGVVAPDLDLAAQPTAVPPVRPDLDLAAQPTAVPPQQFDIVLPPAPTPTQLVIVALPACTGSPATRLAIRDTARTVQPDGTLAMRVNLTDELPTYQIPAGVIVGIVDGPRCRNNLRMWQVVLTLNGQQIMGWIAEGSGSTYYLEPDAA